MILSVRNGGCVAEPEKADLLSTNRKRKVTGLNCIDESVRKYVDVRTADDMSDVSFTCRVCGEEGFSVYTSILRHLFNEHYDVRPFECRHCPYTCRSKSNLICHLKTHGGKDFPCSVCGKAFRFKDKVCVYCSDPFRRLLKMCVPYVCQRCVLFTYVTA